MIVLFYDDRFDQALRFGDIVQGYVSTMPVVERPFVNGAYVKFRIDVEKPQFCVILSPSCSIRRKSVTLTPLQRVRKAFFDNDNFAADLTVINRLMKPEMAIPGEKWRAMPGEQKQEISAKGDVYAFPSLFVYDKHDLLPQYEIPSRNGGILTSYYMIDFGSSYKLECDEIVTPKQSPIGSKILQLSDVSRQELLDKLLGYYQRVKQESETSESD